MNARNCLCCGLAACNRKVAHNRAEYADLGRKKVRHGKGSEEESSHTLSLDGQGGRRSESDRRKRGGDHRLLRG